MEKEKITLFDWVSFIGFMTVGAVTTDVIIQFAIYLLAKIILKFY